MSEVYSRSLITKRPEQDQEFQRAEQKDFARQNAPEKQAIYSSLGLEGAYTNRRASKMMALKQMGLTQKMRDEDLSLRKEGLAHRKKMDKGYVDIAKSRIKFEKQDKLIAGYLGLGNFLMAGVAGYEQLLAERKVSKEMDIRRGLLNTLYMDMMKKDYGTVAGGYSGTDPVGE